MSPSSPLLAAYLRRSACARAVIGILRACRRAGCGGLSCRAVGELLGPRFAAATVGHAILELRRLGLLRCCGVRKRSRQWAVGGGH